MFLIQEDSGRLGSRKQSTVNCEFLFWLSPVSPMLCLADVAKQGITRKTSQNHVSGSWWGAASSQWLLEKKNIFWLSICWCWSSYVYDVAIAIALLWLLDSWLYIVHIDCTLYIVTSCYNRIQQLNWIALVKCNQTKNQQIMQEWVNHLRLAPWNLGWVIRSVISNWGNMKLE